MESRQNGCQNERFIQKTLPLSTLCLVLASIANVIHGAEQYSRAEGKEAASFANPPERIDGAALFASILLIFSRLSASVFAKSNRIVTFS